MKAIHQRYSRCVYTGWLVLLFVLSGCDYIASALPPTPSPFPTLARLPSVTPVTPSPTWTPAPTRTSTPVVTPTPLLLIGTVAVGANVRSGPGTEFPIVTSLVSGTTVTLEARIDAGWYRIVTPEGVEAWMSEQVLDVPPDIVEQIPLVEPDS
ncbi:MAG: SH3 domain-containing protein [Chloroflexaceae bacterium]|nr:SH3 domain-containing protein [Chloroflexaceae bacterium]NJO07813.1 SH3 domain-containing protein [Chloroflexaceae bacterium]